MQTVESILAEHSPLFMLHGVIYDRHLEAMYQFLDDADFTSAEKNDIFLYNMAVYADVYSLQRGQISPLVLTDDIEALNWCLGVMDLWIFKILQDEDDPKPEIQKLIERGHTFGCYVGDTEPMEWVSGASLRQTALVAVVQKFRTLAFAYNNRKPALN